ncbi:hypothetical protein [Streptacidiphilus sp. PAMC 29251]
MSSLLFRGRDDGPDRAVLVAAPWDATRTAAQLAVPPLSGTTGWRLRRFVCDGHTACRLRTGALEDEGPLVLADRSLDLHHGSLAVSGDA